MNLQHCTWPEVEQYLAKSTGIIVPIGSTEQHGPNGLIGTDAICPEILARTAAEQADIMIAPTINYGMAQHHLGFPGTVALRPSTLLALVKDVVASLALHGFTHIWFLNGHGGNTATVTAAFAEYYAENSFSGQVAPRVVHTRIVNWWHLPSVVDLSKKHYPDIEGSHATPSEVALSYYAIDEEVRQAPMQPAVAPTGPIYDAADYRQRFPDGRIGSNPAPATRAVGEEICQTVARDVLAEYRKFLELE